MFLLEIYVCFKFLRKFYGAMRFNIGLFYCQGQDIYKSKQVRDKQIARILGKVIQSNIFLHYLYPSPN